MLVDAPARQNASARPVPRRDRIRGGGGLNGSLAFSRFNSGNREKRVEGAPFPILRIPARFCAASVPLKP